MHQIRFRTNPHKALEVILWFAARRDGIDFHSILKLLFFADKYHLNRYGRPIVGDQYKALSYGPVAQTTYDILKREPLALQDLGLEEVPFIVRGSYRVHPERAPNLRKLSASDIEALEYAWTNYAHLDFNKRIDLSHLDPAYLNADGQTMRYEDFIEDTDEKAGILDDLRDTAPRLVI